MRARPCRSQPLAGGPWIAAGSCRGRVRALCPLRMDGAVALAATERELLTLHEVGAAELAVLARDVPVMAARGGLSCMGSLAVVCGGGRIAVADVSKAGSSGGAGVLAVLPPQRPPAPGSRPTSPPSGTSTEDFQLEAAAWAARDASRSRWERAWSPALCAALLDPARGLVLVGTARRALEVWDVQNDCVAASSGVMGSSPPRCLTLLPGLEGSQSGAAAVAVGTQAGEVLLGWVSRAPGGGLSAAAGGAISVRATVVSRLSLPLLQTAHLSSAGGAGGATGPAGAMPSAAYHAPSAGVLVQPADAVAVTGFTLAGARGSPAGSPASAADDGGSRVPAWLASMSSPESRQSPGLLVCSCAAGLVALDVASRLPVSVASGGVCGGRGSGGGTQGVVWAAAPGVRLSVSTTARGEQAVEVSRSLAGDEMDPPPALGRTAGGGIACVWSVWGRSASVVSSGWLRHAEDGSDFSDDDTHKRGAEGSAAARSIGARSGPSRDVLGRGYGSAGRDAALRGSGDEGSALDEEGLDEEAYEADSFDDDGGSSAGRDESAGSERGGGADRWRGRAHSPVCGAGALEAAAAEEAARVDATGGPTSGSLPAWLLGAPGGGDGGEAASLATATAGQGRAARGKWASTSRPAAPDLASPGAGAGGRRLPGGRHRDHTGAHCSARTLSRGTRTSDRCASPLTPSPRRAREAAASRGGATTGSTIASVLRAQAGAQVGGCLAGAAPTLPLPAALAGQQQVRGLRAADPPSRGAQGRRRGGARAAAAPSAAVVFDGSRIRSSGYGGTAPRTALFGAGRKAKPAPPRNPAVRAASRAQALAAAVASPKDPQTVAASLVAESGRAGAAASGYPMDAPAPSRWSERFRDWLDADSASGPGRARAAVSGGASVASSALRRACVDRQGRVLVLGGWDGAVTTVALPAAPPGTTKWTPGGPGAGGAGVVRGEPEAHATASAAAGAGAGHGGGAGGGGSVGAGGGRGALLSAGSSGAGAVLALATSWRSYRAGALVLRQRQAGSGVRSASDARQASVPLLASVHASGPVCVWAAGRSAPLLTLRRRSGAIGTARVEASARGGARSRSRSRSTAAAAVGGGGASSRGSDRSAAGGAVDGPSGAGFCHADRVMCVAARRELLVYDLTVEEGGLSDGVQGRDGLSRCRLVADLGLDDTPTAAAAGGGGGRRGAGRLAGRQSRATTCLHTEQGPGGTGLLVGLSDGTVCSVDLSAGGGPAICGGFALPEAAVPRVVRAFGDVALTASMGSSSAGSAAPLLAWDLRTACAGPVAAFAGQTQRLGGPLCAGATLTPCGRFVVTGSADASCYVFDLRAPAVPLARLRGPPDSVADVCAHPHTPLVWAACADGSVVAYH